MACRGSRRISTDLQVLIYQSGLPIVMGRVRNMSRLGLFIDCAADDFSLYQMLEVELFISNAKLAGGRRFKGILTRKKTDGLALAILDECQAAYALHVDCVESKCNVLAAAGAQIAT